jgi:hypothetical protein
MKPRVISVAVLAMLAVGLAVPVSAQATPPSRVTIDESATVVYSCGLVEEVDFHRSFTTFYDQAGNETRTLEQVSFEGVITDLATGKTFVDRGHVTVEFAAGFTTGFSLTGIVYTIHLPAEGILHLDVGRLITDADFNTVFQSAKAIDFFDKDGAICAALT